jgi:hypothetical protein
MTSHYVYNHYSSIWSLSRASVGELSLVCGYGYGLVAILFGSLSPPRILLVKRQQRCRVNGRKRNNQHLLASWQSTGGRLFRQEIASGKGGASVGFARSLPPLPLNESSGRLYTSRGGRYNKPRFPSSLLTRRTDPNSHTRSSICLPCGLLCPWFRPFSPQSLEATQSIRIRICNRDKAA